MNRDEMRAALKAKGVGDDLIARVIAREFGEDAPADATVAVDQWPLRLTLPWTALCSDNRKYGAAVVKNGTTHFPKLVMTPRYREAKAKARQLAAKAMGGVSPVEFPLMLTARVYVPDNRQGHDVCNFAKCCLDAFEGVIYKNDAQLHSVLWLRSGVDVDAPRAEIEVRPS